MARSVFLASLAVAEGSLLLAIRRRCRLCRLLGLLEGWLVWLLEWELCWWGR